MTTRRDFLRLGALFVPAVVAPSVAYSFLWARREIWLDQFAKDWNMPQRLAGESDDLFKARLEDVFRISRPRTAVIDGVVYEVYEAGPISSLPIRVIVH